MKEMLKKAALRGLCVILTMAFVGMCVAIGSMIYTKTVYSASPPNQISGAVDYNEHDTTLSAKKVKIVGSSGSGYDTNLDATKVKIVGSSGSGYDTSLDATKVDLRGIGGTAVSGSIYNTTDYSLRTTLTGDQRVLITTSTNSTGKTLVASPRTINGASLSGDLAVTCSAVLYDSTSTSTNVERRVSLRTGADGATVSQPYAVTFHEGIYAACNTTNCRVFVTYENQTPGQ